MTLFPEAGRTQSGPKRPTQHTYDYYTRTDSTEMARVREMLEEWFSHYPEDRQERLRRDFQHRFQDAFHELLVHELLRRTEGRVEVHPNLDTEPETTPDFRVTRDDGSRYIVEATVATDESHEEAGLRRVREDLKERLAQMEFPGWTFDVTFARVTSDAESAGRIERFLRGRMEGLDRDEVKRRYERRDYRRVPEFTYESEKVTLKFRPIPVHYDPHEGEEWNWGSVGVSSDSDEAEVRFPGAGLREKLDSKRPGRYGDFGLPYVVAVNATASYRPMIEDVISALFGTLAVQFERSTGESRSVRQPDGVWHAKNGPTHTRISAVLAGLWVVPYNVARADVLLVRNPWAEHPYEGALHRLPRLEVQDRELVERQGETLGEILGLPAEWPEVGR